MSMFRGDVFSDLGIPEPVVTSPAHKEVYICQCGATKFTCIATNGVIKAGGFKPDSYEYKCLGCGRTHTDEMVKKFFL